MITSFQHLYISRHTFKGVCWASTLSACCIACKLLVTSLALNWNCKNDVRCISECRKCLLKEIISPLLIKFLLSFISARFCFNLIRWAYGHSSNLNTLPEICTTFSRKLHSLECIVLNLGDVMGSSPSSQHCIIRSEKYQCYLCTDVLSFLLTACFRYYVKISFVLQKTVFLGRWSS